MEETPQQRSARRAMSAWLTKQINDVATPGDIATPAIRAKVLEALKEIDARITALNQSLQEKHHVVHGRDLVKFYMKGGNAFECVRDPNGIAATQNGGGTSDWDTQVIVDPWAPVPLQAIVYGLLEELVMDAMIKAGADIASVAGEFVKKTENRWAGQRANLDTANYSAYTLQYDEPQSLRRVFDQQRLGLWTNDQRRISAPNVQYPDRIPGILLNDAIRPFILHRLGYTWHAKLAQQSQPPQGNVGDILKPILMELIDVTLPRRDTIEAVTVWEELAQRQIKIEKRDVAVKLPDRPDPPLETVKLPLPDIMYHLREIATMLCEIADGSSHHRDKLEKRFKRFRLIWDDSDANQKRDIIHALSAMAGVPDILKDPPPHVAGVDDVIQQYGGEQTQAILEDGDTAYRLARNLMDRIADGIARQNNYFFINKDGNSEVSTKLEIRFQEARHELKRWIDQAKAQLSDSVAAGVLDGAFSDDLVLILLLQQEKYLAPQEIGFSDVFQASVIRVATELHVYLLGDSLLKLFDRLSASIEDPSRKFSVLSREYNVPRATGNTNELTMVVFRGGKAIAYVSVSNAPASEAPFRQDVRFPDMNLASLPEIAAQRKVAAALIEDYLVRKAISRQYEALKTLLPVI